MERRLKALIIAEIPAPYRVDVFIEMAKSMDVDVFFQANKDQSRSPDYFVKSARFPFSILDNKQGKKFFVKALKEIRDYDLLIAYHPVCKAALKAEWICKKNNIPYFVNIDGAFIKPSIIKDSIKRWVYRGAAGCFSGSKAATQYFLYYGVRKEKIIEYGFSGLHKKDVAQAICSEEEKKKTRDYLGLEDKMTIIAVGQFILRKGFDLLLDAWNRIDKENAQLIIIGGGPNRTAYESFISNNSLNNVILLDYVEKEKINLYYRASDIFVLPTREDVWGLVINEAMAQGLPVLTTNMCNAGTQLIENGQNGYVVPVTVEAIAEKLYSMMERSDLPQMGEKNIKKISDYTIENTADSHIRTIKAIMDKP